ncbi:tail terminator [Gordonia phage ObLaDi]|uniref:Tail terminator n=2 Tax=Cafassovirus TaxID=3425056 RepID=A0AAE7VDH8_9CAUD|nr:tail terminator [Gordonia phage Cafasso]UXE03735.1 tail terminator [Gordonia phage ObLaDi]
MTFYGTWPDAEDVACDLAETIPELGPGKGFNELPTDPDELRALLPLAWCYKTGGACDDVTDRPIISFNVIAETRSEANRIVTKLRDAIIAARGTKVNGILIDSTEEKNGTKFQPPPRLKQPMATIVHQLSFRRQ